MSSSLRAAGGIGAAVLAGAALTMAQAPARAAAKKVVFVPCSAPALAAAITAANVTPTTIRLSADCTYDITTPAVIGSTALPPITGNVTMIGGPSTALRRDPNIAVARILQVNAGGRLDLEGVFVLNGIADGAGGGGILNNGSLVLRQDTLSGNTGPNGGAVSNGATANALISRTVISSNSTTGSGGGVINLGSLTVSGSRLTGNTSGIDGGGIATVSGATHLIQSTIDRNVATGTGGGIYNVATTTLSRTLVELNRAVNVGGGGGIRNVAPGVVTLSVSSVRNNTPDNCSPPNTISGCVH
ncbi:hypothetical protein [Actinomadura sp. DC4]|uniref:hypothetical protein n=1 Tax=Actinomadura sp. DC4 TaxID=3055069 RepID=UPI0025B1BC41|nr:hypothetical protein [Actinomadura sp. DC4]MDN3358094.1 hypothetical protein [Actinomadura sp. DC4]